jgi:hypothetical protein
MAFIMLAAVTSSAEAYPQLHRPPDVNADTTGPANYLTFLGYLPEAWAGGEERAEVPR